jgi:DNA repair exonuclease SbcCD ATPase subunit
VFKLIAMSSTQAKIQEAASQHASLLKGLHETDSAPSQLQQQDAYIRDLDQQIGQINTRIAGLKRKTASELKDHEKYRDSTLRRFAHKATGRKEKFAEKAAKEEKEYFDAIQAQKSAEDQLTYLQHLKSEASTQRQTFAASADRHTHLQSQLDALYNSIFAGHTPDFPDEDRKEEACNASIHQVQRLHQTISHKKHILFLLGQTSTKLSEARNSLDSAYNMSQLDMFSGSSMPSMQKRNYLERAESAIQQVRMLQDQLHQVAPEIPSLGPLRIAMGSIWSDVVFDNIFTDMQMHDKIKASIEQVDRAGAQCGDVIRAKERELEGVKGEVAQAEGRLKEARMELQKAREEVFGRVVGGGDGGTAGVGGDGGVVGVGDEVPGYAPPSGPPPGYSG